jgi:hypothetical protein
MTAWEYYLDPPAKSGTFSSKILAEMRAHILTLPTIQTHENDFYLFADAADRESDREYILANPTHFYERRASLHLGPSVVMLASVRNERTDLLLRDFVVWCLARWPLGFRMSGRTGPAVPDNLVGGYD